MNHRQVIQDSLDYIEANLKTDLSAQELASLAGYSLFHYYRLFQSATGMSVMQYILRRKLLHSIYEISRGYKRIDVIGCYGFDTYSGFYKAFLREFGCTPTVYLKKNRAKKPYRVNLCQEEHMELTHKKAREILKAWNLPLEPLSDIYNENIGSKIENALYAGQNYVLKFTPNLGDVQKSIALSAALTGSGLNTAAVQPAANGAEFIQDGGLYFFLTNRLPGKPLSVSDLHNDDTARSMGEAIGKLHLALREIRTVVNEANLLDTLSTWAMPTAQKAMGLPRSFCDNFLSTIGCLYPSLPRQVIHRDPNPGNLLHDGSTWGFLDFTLSEHNVRIYDPCYAATAILSESFSPGITDPFPQWIAVYQNLFAGYHCVIGMSPAEREAVPYILLANQLICTAWFSGQEKYAELFALNKTMTQWLIDHFDQLQLNA